MELWECARRLQAIRRSERELSPWRFPVGADIYFASDAGGRHKKEVKHDPFTIFSGY